MRRLYLALGALLLLLALVLPPISLSTSTDSPPGLIGFNSNNQQIGVFTPLPKDYAKSIYKGAGACGNLTLPVLYQGGITSEDYFANGYPGFGFVVRWQYQDGRPANVGHTTFENQKTPDGKHLLYWVSIDYTYTEMNLGPCPMPQTTSTQTTSQTTTQNIPAPRTIELRAPLALAGIALIIFGLLRREH